jgi:16S rRNA (uracil1498-N3)-methyltransferase
LQTHATLKIVLAETERGITLKQALAANRKMETGSSLALAVGPEGGWREDELAAFAEAGWISASLGPTILRSETAAIAALAIAIS